MHRLPGDAGQRHLAGEVEKDDSTAMGHWGSRVGARGAEWGAAGQRATRPILPAPRRAHPVA